MDEHVIFASIGLVAFSAVYVMVLSHTEMGKALNEAAEIQPFLTAVGLTPVMLAAALLGDVNGLELAILFAAVGTPFLARGLYRLGKTYVRQARITRWGISDAGRTSGGSATD